MSNNRHLSMKSFNTSGSVGEMRLHSFLAKVLEADIYQIVTLENKTVIYYYKPQAEEGSDGNRTSKEEVTE